MTVYIHSSVAEGNPDVIDTTTHSNGWSRELSPFYLGPVKLWGDYVSQTVEAGWQNTRAYACHVDENGDPTDEWWKWAKAGWNNPKAVRYPMGKGVKPLYHYWDGEKLGYIEARARIYCPLYAATVLKTAAWKKLKDIYEEKREIHIWSFDSYDHRALGMSYTDVLKCRSRKMGHSYVLGMLLEDKRVWENWVKARSLF